MIEGQHEQRLRTQILQPELTEGLVLVERLPKVATSQYYPLFGNTRNTPRELHSIRGTWGSALGRVLRRRTPSSYF